MKGNKSAYPHPYQNADGTIQHDVDTGLTIREKFAAMAMQGIISTLSSSAQIGESTVNQIAKESVLMADALIAKLNK